MQLVYPTVPTGVHVSPTKGLTLDKISFDLADRDARLPIEELHFQLTQYDAYAGYNDNVKVDARTDQALSKFRKRHRR